jgi:transcriptional regulator with XRE-family HTH domain
VTDRLPLEQIRARLEDAMGTDGPIPDWLEEACARLTRFRNLLDRRRLFDVSTVGARIRTAREVKGYTQRQLAARLGLKHPAHIQEWERENRDVPARWFLRLAIAVGVKPEWLLHGGDVGGPRYGAREAPKKLTRVGWCHTTRLERRKRLAQLELERVRALRMDAGPALPSGQRPPSPPSPHACAPPERPEGSAEGG